MNMTKAKVNERFRIELPIRYRTAGEADWKKGMTVNISRTGMLFLCNLPLEVGARAEVSVPGWESGQARFRSSLVTVVRRVLMMWPNEVRAAVAVKFEEDAEECPAMPLAAGA